MERQQQQQSAGTEVSPTPATGGVDSRGEAARAQSAAVEGKPYTIVTGDTLSRIAASTLGDASQWREIYDVNREIIGEDPGLIFPGQLITIPTPETEAEAGAGDGGGDTSGGGDAGGGGGGGDAGGGAQANTQGRAPEAEQTTTEAAPEAAAAGEPEVTAETGEPSVDFVVWQSAERLGQAELRTARTAIEAVFTGWGLPFDSSGVTLHTFPDKTVGVVLAWQTEWGTAPITADLGQAAGPLDARLAVAVAQQAAGWKQVLPETQGQLEALLGGETNGLSLAARDAFRVFATDPGWVGQPANAQAEIMEGLLTSDDARPYLSGPIGGSKPAEYTLSEATLVADHAFRGVTGDADQYTVTVGTQTVTVYAPHAPDPANGHFHTVEQAAIAIATLPEATLQVVNSVTLNAVQNPDDAYWAAEYNTPDFRSYMTAGASGDITIYPTTSAVDQAEMSGSMIHETGHTWSKQQWGEDTTGPKWAPWRNAMASDRASVSNYATSSLDEDVAETMQVYQDSQGTPQHAEYQAIIPARFAVLDQYF